MPPVETWLIRHGESVSNAGLPAVGNAEVGLTPKGEAQSIEAAGRIPSRPDLLIVSPFLRAQFMATQVEELWPGLTRETWPIYELTYLSPARCLGTTHETRRSVIEEYWRHCDPHYKDGEDAESIAEFLQRLQGFHQRLQSLHLPFVVAIGHGHFFSAYLFALEHGFDATSEWMRGYRSAETVKPMQNGEIVMLSASTR